MDIELLDAALYDIRIVHVGVCFERAKISTLDTVRHGAADRFRFAA